MRGTAVATVTILLAACTAGDGEPQPTSVAVVQPVRSPAPAPGPTPAPVPTPAPAVTGSPTFVFDGELTQGGWIVGEAPGGTVSATLEHRPLVLDSDGRFFAAFDRDSPGTVTLAARLADGRTVRSPLSVSPRAWRIERINAARRPGGSTEAFMALRRPELARIAAARKVESDVGGWRQDFVWPVKGRISGRFGSQRIYRGEPGSYHTGLDIAPGAGTPYVAPADGVVVLAATSPFTLEGHLLMIDHGGGLNSAFLHSQRLAVTEGQRVSQGQLLGYVGASGRTTGPHLHWSLEWQGARLDPLLFLPPQ
ncbi:Murein hydrolase activator NlpD precursor [Tsuneonella dongtanensis]|uniref:Murein hydrolase activator NlpD n=1 Tax=Tsuneonella dongtanensis TaxID=692370 RepID=A0A1B2AAA7_9SPHN|nr:M23 family metallopeptidase [Tsuneonella dongtanensis]ANY19076.1 Murein hydrolase activator NlpD precursor [Tsuneonella dongtanensis]